MTTPLTLEQILANPKLSQAIQKEMGVSEEEIQKSLYGSLSVKQAKAQIDALDEDATILLGIRILSLLGGVEVAIDDSNPLLEAMAAFSNKELGLLFQHVAKKEQFKSRTKAKTAAKTVEIPCAL